MYKINTVQVRCGYWTLKVLPIMVIRKTIDIYYAQERVTGKSLIKIRTAIHHNLNYYAAKSIILSFIVVCITIGIRIRFVHLALGIVIVQIE